MTAPIIPLAYAPGPTISTTPVSRCSTCERQTAGLRCGECQKGDKHMSGYTAVYRFEKLAGESGWSYQCLFNGRLIFEGWSRGAKRDAEAEVRNGISAREALISAVSL